MKAMMRTAAAVALAVVMLPTLGHAQRAWDISFGAGPSFPVSELGEEAETGFHAHGLVGFQLPGFPAKLRVGAFYQNFNAVEREPSINVSLGGEWYRQLSAVVDAVIQLPMDAPVQPYALVGAGWLREWHDDRTYSGKNHMTIGFNAGGGVEFPIFGVHGYLEARYMGLGSSALETGPPAVYPEVNFKAIPVTLGVRL